MFDLRTEMVLKTTDYEYVFSINQNQTDNSINPILLHTQVKVQNEYSADKNCEF